MKNLITIILLLILSGLGCLKKQDHPPLEPVWPHYKFSGIVLDSIGKDPVDSCVVTVITHKSAYPSINATGMTDSSGIFIIDSVYHGEYSVIAEKEDYGIFTGRMMMEHRDQLDFRISMIKLSDTPDIAVSDSIFSVELVRGNSIDHTLTIFNKGSALALSWELTGSGGWVTVNPQSGSVLPKGSQAVNLHFSTSGLIDEIYRKSLYINSNDYDEPVKEIFVRLWVK